MSVTLRTASEKRAAAEWLADNFPDLLDDLRMFSDAFGPMAEMSLNLDDAEASLAFAVDLARKREA